VKIKLYDIYSKEEVLHEDFSGVTTLESVHSGKRAVKEIIDIIFNPDGLIILVEFKEKANMSEPLPEPSPAYTSSQEIYLDPHQI